MIFTGDVLLASVKRNVMLPFNQNQLSDSDLLAFADEEIAARIMPEIIKLREEYAVYTETVPLVASVSNYQIPRRASGRVLRFLELQLDSTTTIAMAQIARADQRYYSNNTTGTYPTGFYYQNDQVIVLPPVGTSPTQSLVFSFMMRHSQMTKLGSAGVVTNINTSTGDVTLSQAFPSIISAGMLMDFVGAQSESVILGYDVPLTNVSGATVSFAPVNLPANLSIGDYVTLAQQTPVILLPEECGPAVMQAVTVRVLTAQKDLEALPLAQAELQVKINSMRELLTPRMEGEPQMVINRNGLLRNQARNIMRNLKV